MFSLLLKPTSSQAKMALKSTNSGAEPTYVSMSSFFLPTDIENPSGINVLIIFYRQIG